MENNDLCYHCGLSVPRNSQYKVTIFNTPRKMCCNGCAAVAQAIVDNKLSDFYRHRTNKSNTNQTQQLIVPEVLDKLDIYDQPALQQSFVTQQATMLKQTSLIMEGIVCAACVWLNEKYITALPGVDKFAINYSTHRALLVWDETLIKLSDILKAISRIGYIAHPYDPGRQQQLIEQQYKTALKRIAVAALAAMQVMMFAIAMYAADYTDTIGSSRLSMDENLRSLMRWISLLFTTPVVFFSARPFFQSAFADLRRFRLGMDVSVSLAISAAFVASIWATISHVGAVYYDSVTMFTLFLLSGRFLEMRVRHQAGQAAEQLVRLQPAVCTRLIGDKQHIISVAELVVADTVLVKAGELIPVDGSVVSGDTTVDESLLSGESHPLTKQVGDSVIGGSINIDSPLIIRVTKVGKNTVLAAISRLLDRAQSEKPRLAQLANSVASWFIFFLLLFTVVVATVWWFHDPDRLFEIVLAVLVVSCPCALSLATPTSITAATSSLTQHGVLTTRAHALETLAKVTHFVFDKTGTLSYGQPKLKTTTVLGSYTERQLKRIAASLEQYSEHPLAKELINASTESKLSCSNVVSYAGKGVLGTINHCQYAIGNALFIKQQCRLSCPALHNTTNTGVFLACYSATGESQLLARFEFSDCLREEASASIKALKSLPKKIRIKTVLLSGDDDAITQKIALAFEFDEVRGNCTPQDKFDYVQQLQQQGAIVAMVGDGVNDAPVLAAAQVSIAMGGATQLAQTNADMVLLSNKLNHIVVAVHIATRTVNIIRQNFAWAILYNLLAVPLAAMGIITPWMAALGMSASSLIVVFNALRLSRVTNHKFAL